ncbi:MAG TPA: hypothetical protein VKB96_18645 [Gammaproteobacteria bacterium]|nr:hypothetical protein [Gammaproteobacteria bacterium]
MSVAFAVRAATPGRHLASYPPALQQFDITIPEATSLFKAILSKASFHERGDFHIKLTNQATGATTVAAWQEKMSKQSIVSSVRFIVLISKAFESYSSYEGNVTRGNGSPLLLDEPDENASLRFYLEFFLTPAGTFTFLPPLLKCRTYSPVPPATTFNEHRSHPSGTQMEFSAESEVTMWHPEVEISIYGLDAP